MESNYMTEDMAARMEEMKAEIAALKELLAEKKDEAVSRIPDIKSMVEEGFAKVSDAIRPLAEEANRRIGNPTKEAVSRVEEKIAVHPFAAVMIALGAGLVVGKMLDIATRPVYVERRDD